MFRLEYPARLSVRFFSFQIIILLFYPFKIHVCCSSVCYRQTLLDIDIRLFVPTESHIDFHGLFIIEYSFLFTRGGQNNTNTRAIFIH